MEREVKDLARSLPHGVQGEGTPDPLVCRYFLGGR